MSIFAVSVTLSIVFSVSVRLCVPLNVVTVSVMVGRNSISWLLPTRTMAPSAASELQAVEPSPST